MANVTANSNTNTEAMLHEYR